MSDNAFRKELATRLADTLNESATLSLLQLLCHSSAYVDLGSAGQGLGPFAALADDVLGLLSSPSTGPRVGIWEQEPHTGDFVRSREHVDLWQFCAAVDRIPRKGVRKRIAFLGESVARGFFFDPFYCPSRVLQELLSSAGESVEVVDLAQSNSDAWWLSVVASATKLLEPDAIVVFAGNNWRGGPLANISAEHCAVDGALLTADRGFSELVARQRRRLDSLAEETVTQLSLSAAEAGVPLIMIVPEVNVADWSTCPSGTLDVPVMSGADTRHWIRAYRGALEALEHGDPARAEKLVGEAIDCDGGTSAASLDLLASAQKNLGLIREAAATRRRSRDLTVGVLDGTKAAPGVFFNVANTIRRIGARVGATIVDLQEMFAAYCPDDPPGRRLFLDYCHLTPEGIRIAMAATAKAVAPVLAIKTIEFAELLDRAISPTPEQEGWGYLLAGLHNAHWGQQTEICKSHFRRAIECYPILLQEAVPNLFEAFRRATPPPLLSSFDKLVQHEIAAVYLLGYGSTFRSVGAMSEYGLLTALSAAFPSLENVSPDPDFTLGDMLEIDLLDPHWSNLVDPNRWFRRAFTVVYGIKSVFPFVCDRPRCLSVALTCRVPGSSEPADLAVELNACAIGSIQVDDHWRSGRCTADECFVRRGLNELTIWWPNALRCDMRPRIRQSFETGKLVDLRTHFGELHELRISVE